MNRVTMFQLLAIRLFKRTDFKITFSISLLFVLVGFAESCLHFYGAEAGELPSPAFGWAWNMNFLQINSMYVYLFFFMPLLAALVFSGNAYQDIKSGMAACLSARSTLRTYLLSNLALSYLGGFLLVFVSLTTFQLMAFIAFPLNGSLQGYLGVPAYQDQFILDPILGDLRQSAPYLYNLCFAAWAASWSGACSLISFALSFYITRYKSISLVIPSIISLAGFAVVPAISGNLTSYLHFWYCFPYNSMQLQGAIFFIVYPLLFNLVSIAIALLPLYKKKDVLL